MSNHLKSLNTLEWPALFEQLLSLCHTPYGILAWRENPFLDSAEEAQAHSESVEQLKRFIVRFGDPVTSGKLHEIAAQLRRIEKGGTLTFDELGRFHETLQQGHLYQHHFLQKAEQFAAHDYQAFLSALPYFREPIVISDILEALNQYLDEDHQLKITASKRYGELVKRIRVERQALVQRLENYLSDSTLSGIFQNATITERDGRLVLPVKIEYRSQLPGMVHASSGSGSTLFIEPQNAVELNNRIQSFESELIAEIERLLEEISRTLEPDVIRLDAWLLQIGLLDRQASAARLSRLIQASPVQFRDTPGFVFRNAKHPLLLFQHLGNFQSIIANDIELATDNPKQKTLVITGPNTGGKTVILKTVGLFCWMAKAGLHLPTAENSSTFFFENIYADIGDQQSLEQNLSTFSGHIANMKPLVSVESDLSKSLVLIDEIAAGTDPAEGAALAKSVLETLYEKQATTIVTTHLGELKVEAHHHDGYVNASVEFNTDTLRPTYRLLLGVPGTSNAITIAQTLGLNSQVTDKARANLSAPVRDAGDLIASLELKNQKMHDALAEAEAARNQAKADADKIAEERAYLESEKRRILQQYQSQLKSRVHDLDAELKQLRKSLQQETQHLESIGKLGQDIRALSNIADEVFEQSETQIEAAETISIDQLTIGQTIVSKKLGLTGNIIAKSDTGKEVIMQSGLMRLTIPLDDIQTEGTSRRQQKKRHYNQTSHLRQPDTSSSIQVEMRPVRMELDVRGQHMDEALRQVGQFLDDAVLQGLSQVGIIHGLGTGVLKKEIRQLLKQTKYVRHYRPAEAIDGGDGKTVVELK